MRFEITGLLTGQSFILLLQLNKSCVDTPDFNLTIAY